MRGKGTFGVDTSTTTGITPAYAGKSMIGENAFYGTGDHPRLCGEKVGILIVQLCQLGSPPPMRGKGFFCRHSIIFAGITPAYAGKSSGTVRGTLRSRDHPRLCGEKSLVCKYRSRALGSPPPMRGKVSIFSPPNYNTRITPAYAGKSE